MTGTIIVIRPCATSPTMLSNAYAESLVNWLQTTGLRVIDMQGPAISQPGLYTTLAYTKLDNKVPPFICYYGHGLDEALIGDENIVELPFIGANMALVKKGFNDNWLKDTIVYSYACHSARELGPASIKKGALAYFGGMDPIYVGYPESDNDYANDFSVIANTIPKAIVNGYSVKQSIEIFRNTCDYYIKYYSGKVYEWHNADYYAYAVKATKDSMKLLAKEDMKWAGV